VVDISDPARAPDATLARIPRRRFCPDTKEVTGSNPVSPTALPLVRRALRQPDESGFEGMATMRGRSMEWPRQSRITVGSAASHGVSIVSSKLFPSILT
jgi:hypothetical protein